jgi:hypothetical protein
LGFNKLGIYWETESAMVCRVEYGLSTNYGNISSDISPYEESLYSYSVNLLDVLGKEIHYRVICEDESGQKYRSRDMIYELNDSDYDKLALIDKYVKNPLVQSGTLVSSVLITLILLGLNPLDLLRMLISLGHSMLVLVGLRKKGSRMGTVYDLNNGQPLDNAIVRFYNKSGRLMRTSVTSQFGTYEGPVREGVYKLEISKAGYKFADVKGSKLFGGDRTNYKGGFIKHDGKGELIIDIPMESVKSRKSLLKLRRKLMYLFSTVFLVLWSFMYIIGLVHTLINLVIGNRSILTVVSLVIYILSLLLWIYNLRIKPWKFGKITGINGKALPGAIVRLEDKEFDQVEATRITDDSGLYRVIVESGDYRMSIYSAAYEKATEKNIEILAKSDPTVVARDVKVEYTA